ncbi:MAG TPA: TonB-dependent receptor [Steroidobacteraceae bacterium]|nr:TonB-dependent receptor [Steroidobacteraceae bacterium]
MKTFKQKGNRTKPIQRRPQGEVTAVAGCAIFLMGGSAVMAQDQSAGASAEDIQEVLVTGIRKSIQDSINAKKLDSSIVEVVSAEDIGKLPDSSIAESIARLPGIAAQRTNGRAQTLSIRGLGPDFTVTTFNGREQATTNDNRTVEFDQYPSELVTQVKVYKTPDAGMAYQGIAGTTDISTVHPLSYDGRRTAVTYRREQNEQDVNIPGLTRNGNRANLTYIDQFRDHTLGVAFGVAYNKSPYQAQTKEPWGYADSPTGAGQKIIGGDKSGVQSSFYERMGYLGVVEYQPNDTVHMLLDAYHSDFKELQTIQRVEYGTIWANPTTPVSNPGELDENNRVESGTFDNVPFTVIENYNNDRNAKIDSIGLNSDFKLSESWNLNADLSYSKVERDDLRLESTAGVGKVGDATFPTVTDNISFTTGSDGRSYFAPTINYSDYGAVQLSDPGSWGGGTRRSGFIGHPEINDEIKAIRLTATKKLEGFLSEVSFGVNYADREKSKDPFQSLLYLPGNISHAPVPEAYQTGVTNGAFFGLANGVVSYDAIGLLKSGFWQPIDAAIDPNAGAGDRIYDVTNAWTVNEKLTTAYVKVGIDTELGSLPLRGNIGVQSVTADQNALVGYVNGDTTGVAVLDVTYRNEGAKYTDILPSMNLALELPHDQKLRIGAATTVARPRMDEMGGGNGYSVTPDTGTPTQGPNGELLYWNRNGGGNPELKPWKANTFDLSWEKYFNENQGYFALAAYYKKLTTYIVNESFLFDFTGFELPIGDYTQADTNRFGVATHKINGSGGYIKGVEATLSLPFSTFTQSLNGLGLIVSAAKNESSIKINGADSEIPGLSKTVINTTLYFEKAGFSARVSNRKRGEFIGEVPQFDATLQLNTVAAESIFDAQIGYEFSDGPMEGLSVSLQGTNLTDEPFQLTQVGTPSRDLIKYQTYGANYSVALTYKF